MTAFHPARAERFAAPVLAAALVLGAMMGTRGSLGLFLGPINTGTALGMASISFALACSQLAAGAAQPVVGLAARRYGAVRVIAVGGAVSTLALMLVAFASSAPGLMLALLLSGAAGAGAGSPLLLGAVAQHVSERRRGVALGLVSAGGAAGPLLLAPLAALLLSSVGWQIALVLLAALALLTLPGAAALRGAAASHGAADGAGGTLRAALRDPNYWLVTAGFVVCGFHVSFLVTHMPGVLELCGFSPAFSGTWLAIVASCNVAGSLLSGRLMQRMPMKTLLSALYALRAIGVALFVLAPPSTALTLAFALWMGLTYMATVPPTTGLIARLYGARQVAVLLGVAMALHQVGSFLGAWLGGLERELTGGYRWVWALDILLAAAASLVYWPVREPRTAARAVAA
jgi:predicted MFS family arabinose efflux permease